MDKADIDEIIGVNKIIPRRKLVRKESHSESRVSSVRLDQSFQDLPKELLSNRKKDRHVSFINPDLHAVMRTNSSNESL